MSKKFNIHDWRSKQILKEDISATNNTMIEKLTTALDMKDWTLVKSVIDDLWNTMGRDDNMSLDNIHTFNLNEEGDQLDNLIRYGDDYNADIDGPNPDLRDKHISFLNNLRDEGHLHRYGVIRLQTDFGVSEEEAKYIYNEYLSYIKNEHHDKGNFPEVDQKTKDYLDKLEDTDPSGYKAVEDYIKAMNEMNITSKGASFNAEKGPGYATPAAFNKKKYKQ